MKLILTKENQVRSKKPYKNKKAKKKKIHTPKPKNKKCACGCGKDIRFCSRHHVYYARGQRDLSSIHHAVEGLCWESHQSGIGIHGSKSPNKRLDFNLKRKHQWRLLEEGMKQKEFMQLFGKDYLSMTFKDFSKEGD